jgi:hypothetical protein
MPTDAIAVQIADALAAGLSSHEFSAPYQTISAVRRYVPDYEGSELRSLKVSVVPGSVETERASRGQDLFTHQVAIVLGQHVDGSNQAVDALVLLAQEMVDAIRSQLVAVPEGVLYQASAIETTFDRDSLTDSRVFLSQIVITYRVPRATITAGG